jgi:hypothetical protein
MCAADSPTQSPAPKIPSLPLTLDGQAKAVIVLAHLEGNAGSRELETALKILADHLRQISGASLPVVHEEELQNAKVENGRLVLPAGSKWQADTVILLGEGQLTKRMGLSTAGLGDGGILIKTSGNVLALMGKPIIPHEGATKKGGVSRKGAKKPAEGRLPAGNNGNCGLLQDEKKAGGAVVSGKSKGGGSAIGGTTYAVCRFLEIVGCRYLWPGESGKVVPHLATLVVPPLDMRYTPLVGQRDIRFLPKGPRNFDTGLAVLGCSEAEYEKTRNAALQTESACPWQTWQGLGGDIGIHGGHNGCGLRGGWAEHGAAHPEWFALQSDGTRDQSKAAERWRLCVSNPGLIEYVAQDLIKQLDAAPQTTCISLSPNDGGFSNFCLCDECKKLDAPNGPKIKLLVFDHVGQSARKEIDYVSLTDRYVHYWNAVAERVARSHSKVLFLVDAYSYYSDPPVREKLHPNLVVRYVPSTLDGWKGWQSAGAKRIYWRPNNLHSGYRDGALKVFGGELASTMRYFSDNGMLATDIQGIYDNWATQGMNYYVTARMDWDPRQTYESILDDYCQHGFGPAAQAVKQYFQKAESFTGTVAEKYTANRVAELRELLETARKASANDPAIRKRVTFLRAGLEHTALTAEALRMASQIEAGQPVDRAAGKAVMDRRWQLMRAIALREPLAVNEPVVAGNEQLLRRTLGWSGPGDAAKAAKLNDTPQDDWLNEDQRPR